MKIISGMHRSGTSIVARLMYEAGGDFGDPETFYRPDKWNPDGYYEQPEFHAINMPLVNGPFWKFSYFALPSTRTILRRGRRFAEDIRRVSAKYEGKIVKEVRFSLTLPAWREQGAHFERVLVCLREPREVAESVNMRNKTGLRIPYKLWREHNERLLENAHDLPVWFVLYANLLNPETFADEIRPALEFFGLDSSETTVQSLAGFMREPKNRAESPDRDQYPESVANLWQDLLARHAAQFGKKPQDHVLTHA